MSSRGILEEARCSDCAAGEAQRRGPGSIPRQPQQSRGAKGRFEAGTWGTWGPQAKQQQLNPGGNFPQHEMGTVAGGNASQAGLGAARTSLIPRGAAPEGNCKAFTAACLERPA